MYFCFDGYWYDDFVFMQHLIPCILLYQQDYVDHGSFSFIWPWYIMYKYFFINYSSSFFTISILLFIQHRNQQPVKGVRYWLKLLLFAVRFNLIEVVNIVRIRKASTRESVSQRSNNWKEAIVGRSCPSETSFLRMEKAKNLHLSDMRFF